MKENTTKIRSGRQICRRMLLVACTVALFLMLLGSVVASADTSNDGFRLLKTTPKDKYTRVQAQNVMVKLYFNEAVNDTASVNKENVTFTDKKGNDVKFKIYPDQKRSDMIALLATDDLKVNKTYIVTISGAFVNNDGDSLGRTETISFQTKTSGGGLIYALLMVAMVVVMVFVTIRDQRKKQEEEVVAEGKPASAKQKNPYKLAKEKGISVEEATRIINKEKAKEQKKIDRKLEKQKRREEKIEKQLEEELEEYQIFHVHTKRVVKRHSEKNS